MGLFAFFFLAAVHVLNTFRSGWCAGHFQVRGRYVPGALASHSAAWPARLIRSTTVLRKRLLESTDSVEKGCPQKSLIFSSPRHHRSSGRRLLFCLPIVPDVRLLPHLIVDCYCCFVGRRKNLLAPAGTSRFIRLSLLIQSIVINTLTGLFQLSPLHHHRISFFCAFSFP